MSVNLILQPLNLPIQLLNNLKALVAVLIAYRLAAPLPIQWRGRRAGSRLGMGVLPKPSALAIGL
jgi:hypothetical protein